MLFCRKGPLIGVFLLLGLAGESPAFQFSSVLWKRESRSPARLGSALLIWAGGLAGSDAWIFIRDNKVSAVPIRIGGSYASDGPKKMKHAVWSRDGSVFAVAARVGESAGNGFAKEHGTFFVTGYDFKTHRPLLANPLRQATAIQELSKRIEDLLRQRGGRRAPIFTSSSREPVKPVSAAEAKLYKLHEGQL